MAVEVARKFCGPRCSRIKHIIFILLPNVVIRGKFLLRSPFESVYPSHDSPVLFFLRRVFGK
jgi:hypothetical protein